MILLIIFPGGVVFRDNKLLFHSIIDFFYQTIFQNHHTALTG